MTFSKREQIIETALALFCHDGFHVTGIDRIVHESGVAKMTLYNHFKSKGELILAVLRRKDELWRNWLMHEVECRSQEANKRVLTIFDCLYESIQDDEFCGCLFSAASQEFPQDDNPIHMVAAEHKRLVKAYIKNLLEQLELKNPEDTANKICIIMEGVLSAAQVSNNAQLALDAKEIVELLLQNVESTGEMNAA